MLEYYGIDAGIDLLGAGDCQFQQFGGADLALADQPRQFQRVTAPVFIETHAAVRPSRQRTQPQRGARRQADGALEKMPSCYPGHCSSLFLLSGQASGLKRSEEHTSELQSRPHLVCRLLLEKKK